MLNLFLNLNFNKYYVKKFLVVEDTIEGVAVANTGIAYDKNRHLIYSAITNPIYSNIRIFNERGINLGQLTFGAAQALTYDCINDRLIIWTGSSLLSYSMAGELLFDQEVEVYEDSPNSGSVCYDNINDCLYFSVDGGDHNIAKMVRDNNDWVNYSEITATGLQEGVTYDENTNTIWHNTTTKIRNIQLDGTFIREYNKPAGLLASSEGLAWNPQKNTIYVNVDGYYHGGTPNGNICGELYPNYY